MRVAGEGCSLSRSGRQGGKSDFRRGRAPCSPWAGAALRPCRLVPGCPFPWALAFLLSFLPEAASSSSAPAVRLALGLVGPKRSLLFPMPLPGAVTRLIAPPPPRASSDSSLGFSISRQKFNGDALILCRSPDRVGFRAPNKDPCPREQIRFEPQPKGDD